MTSIFSSTYAGTPAKSPSMRNIKGTALTAEEIGAIAITSILASIAAGLIGYTLALLT